MKDKLGLLTAFFPKSLLTEEHTKATKKRDRTEQQRKKTEEISKDKLSIEKDKTTQNNKNKQNLGIGNGATQLRYLADNLMGCTTIPTNSPNTQNKNKHTHMLTFKCRALVQCNDKTHTKQMPHGEVYECDHSHEFGFARVEIRPQQGKFGSLSPKTSRGTRDFFEGITHWFYFYCASLQVCFLRALGTCVGVGFMPAYRPLCVETCNRNGQLHYFLLAVKYLYSVCFLWIHARAELSAVTRK